MTPWRVPTTEELAAKVTSTALSAWPEDVMAPDFRIGWPDAVGYEWVDDLGVSVSSPVPPIDRPCRRIAVNLAQHDMLDRSGALRDPRHTGTAMGTVTDQRKAPGA